VRRSGRAVAVDSQSADRELEAQVEKLLLVRRKGRVLELTPDGDRLAQYARRLLALNDEAYAALREDTLSGFVRLGVPLDFFGSDFTTWLARFKGNNPMVALEVEANQSENLIKRSAKGKFDLAFLQQAGAGSSTAVLSEQLVWVCGPNYSLDEASIPLVLFAEGCAYRRHAVAATLVSRV
jgi:DNA-binding transcriptional LysR family regulator